jgi:class 3 adenylate cyclase
MPLYMDRHRADPGTTPQDVAAAHYLDQQIEQQYGVRYLTYWFDKDNGGIFCLAEAPSREMAERVHRESHGLLPEEIIEVGIGDVDAYLGRISDPPAAAGEPISDSAFRTIVFTDIAGSTRLTQQLGDQAAMIPLREHDSVVRSALQTHSGKEVKHTGDGIMACFVSVSQALDFCIDVQRGMRVRNAGKSSYAVQVRVGLSAGEPVCDGGDLFGAAVQLARRICDHADPGTIFTSNVVRELSIGKNFRFASAPVVLSCALRRHPWLTKQPRSRSSGQASRASPPPAS